MPIISSVFHNRLKSKNCRRLQSDITKRYANSVKKEMKKRGIVDLELADSYNTYKCFGLPAGPICNPGREAIKAAIKPAKTDYMFFFINLRTKEAFFARTFEEHKKNLKKYLK